MDELKKMIIDEKVLRKQMIEKDVKSINELAAKSGVSKPTIYEYLNGKTPFSSAFVKLCEYLELEPEEILKKESGGEETSNV